MNREIKFRAQKSNNNEIVYFDLKYFLENDEDKMPDGMQYILKNIEQFTGLLDKNGIEIYEGDIVSWKETRLHNQKQIENNIPMPKIYKSIVYYEDGGFIVSSDQEKDTPLCCFFNDSIDNKFDYKAKVIGNIYENPELLNNSVVA